MKLQLWVKVALVSVLLLAVFSACRRRDTAYPRYPSAGPPPQQQQPPYAPPSGYPPSAPQATAAPPPAAPAPSAPPASTPPSQGASTGTPAAGFACASDADLQCPFAHCLNSRCGGCRADSDCKPLSSCLPTPVGMACVPSATHSTPPSAPAPPAPSATPVPPAAPPANDPFVAARARCLARTNEFRARVGSAALGSRSDQWSCVDAQGKRDSDTKTPHSAFGQCSENAQNECPAFKGSLDAVVDRCLQMMFDEGPGEGAGHGHYTNLTNPNYRSLACGFQTAADGSIWLVQDFYR